MPYCMYIYGNTDSALSSLLEKAVARRPWPVKCRQDHRNIFLNIGPIMMEISEILVVRSVLKVLFREDCLTTELLD